MNAYHLLCLSLAWINVAVGRGFRKGLTCGENIYGTHGHFNSPDYPNVYPDSLDCKWNITVPKGYEVFLNFTQFDLEGATFCEYDYVTVESTNGTIGKFCGRRGDPERNAVVPPLEPIIVKDSTLEIHLHTDHSNEIVVHGFEAHFAATDIDECVINNGGCSQFCHNFIGSYYCSCRIGYRLANDGHSCIVQCQNIYYKYHQGIITSPEYPKSYPPNANCDWHITAGIGYFINLEFIDFNLETHDTTKCPYDQLVISDEDHKYGPFCETKPKKFRSKSNWLILEFSSDASNSRENEIKRFKARYWLEGIKCPTLYPPEDGGMKGSGNFTFEETILFTCREGYWLSEGSYSRTCQADGTWTGKAPKCKRITCDHFPKNTHDKIMIRSNRTWPANTQPTYYYKDRLIQSCSPFYDQFGPEYIECQVDGSWSTGRAYCVKTCGRAYPQGNNEALQKCHQGRHRAKAIPYSQPWLVAIMDNNKVICSGILISDDLVLTAGHCVKDSNERKGYPGTLKVLLGMQDLNQINGAKTQVRRVTKVHFQSKFDYVMHSDMSVLQLSFKVRIHERYVQPICIAHDKSHKQLFRGGRNVVSTGWLKSGPKYITDRCVQIERNREKCKLHTDTVHDTYFSKKYKDTTEGRKKMKPVDLMCTSPPKGVSDICKILPGSGLVAYDEITKKWYLGGILTWGSLGHDGCMSMMNTYSIYTKAWKNLKWIKHDVNLKIKEMDATSDKFKDIDYVRRLDFI